LILSAPAANSELLLSASELLLQNAPNGTLSELYKRAVLSVDLLVP
jgi:hypothetical protein